MGPLLDLGTALYHAGIRLATPLSPKARAWTAGRRDLWKRLEDRRTALRGCVWMHCASTGEFEQGRPVLEAFRARHPEVPVLLTFFSPSGYEACKGLGSARPGSLVTHVDYLPADSAGNARRMVGLVEPRLVLWVKYEFWRHHLRALYGAGVPLHLVSAIFRPAQPFFRWYGGPWRTMLRYFTHIHVQDEASRHLLDGIGVRHVSVCGDTRFDRVLAVASENAAIPLAQAFHRAMDAPVLIAGSTWPADEALLAKAFSTLRTPPRLVMVPHEPNPKALDAAERGMPRPLERWSTMEERLARIFPEGTHDAPPDEDPLFARTLLVDRTGLLSRLYRHADIAYVGGGFGSGIHSILEAAAHGRPVIFGPNHRKFPEARGLIEAGGGFAVRDSAELANTLFLLMRDRDALAKAGAAARRFAEEHAGATQRVLAKLRLEW
jgi:3-deoxy-D-manno-octulosonic-acid transferase